ncbi:hypothetical protein [Ornithinimicrobium cryptoxanthini]|uniref:Uncharacterized protein n=1 Tax=Ornithinimicrobium cryptoxanthini TaxID=2934161 RepID=A0ABY4YJ34_9MICO|nr:hypothetical protein [Ornithinimicrobium cryptoxanthini]USQ76250.1 hypothetical protein NF557_16935 [Ornithinimicrobium cryptoxanthini]
MTRRTVGASLPEGEVSASFSDAEVSASSAQLEESVPMAEAGGLQLLGAADAVVCEGDLCWVPPTGD